MARTKSKSRRKKKGAGASKRSARARSAATRSAKARRAPTRAKAKTKRRARKTGRPPRTGARKQASGAKRATARRRRTAQAEGKGQEVLGEGNYTASRNFRRAEEGFVRRNRRNIPKMGKEAEAAMEGPEGQELNEAEDEAKSHAAGEGE